MSETETKSNIQNDPLPPSETSRGKSARDGNVSEREITQNQNPQATDNATENQEDVAAVVTKGTRAAKFLWMLLHSQVCRATGDKCPYQGCAETKRLLLHIKTCPATSPQITCPTSHDGCQQARKLLAHYRICKEERARQRRVNRCKQPSQFCLICTLLARHDKSISLCKRVSKAKTSLSISSPLPIPHQKPMSKNGGIASSFEKIYSPQVHRRKARSKSVQFDLHETKSSERPSMPPPPPRPRAESLDERKRLSNAFENDPTVEFELCAQRSAEKPLDIRPVERQLPFRKRSVSCSLAYEKNPACDTIMEEP